jgi:hypothetical protein
MSGPQRNRKKNPKNETRPCRLYSYVPEEMDQWIYQKAEKHNVTVATMIYSCLEFVKKHHKGINPNDVLSK